MEQLASDACTNRRVACILNSIGWQQGCVGGVLVCVSVCVSSHRSGAVSCSCYSAAA